MNMKNVFWEVKNKPELDPSFIPFEGFIRAFLKKAVKPVSIVLTRNGSLQSVFQTYICGTENMREADRLYLERMVKFLLWQKGGYELTIYGDSELAEFISSVYGDKGQRDFDFHFMSNVYEAPFVVRDGGLAQPPRERENPRRIGRHLNGCRIGFDAGGSDRKVSAVINGEPVFSEEVVWFPKENANSDYHYQGILAAFRKAAGKMPRVDGIGVSSAGIYVGNRAMAASLFIKVPKPEFDSKVKDIYIRAAAEIGDVPVVVANDGDVTALAGAMSLNETNILGIAMGTSEAVGFIDKGGNITGWLNELAFAPVDLQEGALADEWSGDRGVGCKYFSQDAVIKLAPAAGLSLDQSLSLADKLKAVQKLMEDGDERAAAIYRSMGCYLGHTLPLYYRFYRMKHVLLMGRVTSGKGGSLMVQEASRVMTNEYPDLKDLIELELPNEKSRRVGQSIAAASLPEITV